MLSCSHYINTSNKTMQRKRVVAACWDNKVIAAGSARGYASLLS